MNKKAAFFLALLMLSCSLAFAQEHKQEFPINFGLTSPLPDSLLPKSKALPTPAVRRAKTSSAARLEPQANDVWRIAGGWELASDDEVIGMRGSIFDEDYNTSAWYNAVVPGTVLTTLVDAGVYPDPYYGLNNMSIPEDLCRREWWYRIAFPLPEHSGNRTWLRFDGINYRADVWLNRHKLGSIEGAFVQARFDITPYLAPTNVLAVKIYPPYNPGIPHEQSGKSGCGPNGGQLCFDGPTFISSEGWDWIPGIRDRNIGIWQDVFLESTGDVRLEYPRIVTDLPLPDTDYADLSVSVDVVNLADQAKQVVLKGQIGDGISFEHPTSLRPGEHRKVVLTKDLIPALRIGKPRLWWPNGYGKQEMYTMDISVFDGTRCSDKCTVPFGIRELSYELSVFSDTAGELRIDYSPTNDIRNGVIPFTSVPARETSEKDVVIARLLPSTDISQLSVIGQDGTAPYLVIRCNGKRIFCRGGNWGMDDGMKRVSRERLEPAFRLHREAGFNMVRNWTGENTEDLFYTLCDEYGMLVWNDFWLSTEGFNQNVNDEVLFARNAREVVKRFRNHPSIAVWCPRNEGYAPTSLNRMLVDIIAEEDGTRHYNPNSRYMNLRPSGPWQHRADISDYHTRIAHGFSTELGTPSVPTAETMEKFIPESERWPISDTWNYHDLHGGLPEYCSAIDSMYGESSSMSEFCKKAQMVNYDSYRAMFESWNSRLWNSCTGLLLWMTHPAWPSLEWQTYSWDFETHGSFFGSKKACEPVHIQRNPHDGKVMVLNLSPLAMQQLTAVAARYTLSGKQLFRKEIKIKDIPSNTLQHVFTLTPLTGEDIIIERLEIYQHGRLVSRNDYLVQSANRFHALNDLPSPMLKARIRANGKERKEIEIVNTGSSAAIALKFNVRRRDTGEAVLPAYFSEGYLHLLPGEKYRLTVDCADFTNTVLSAEGYNLNRQQILELNSHSAGGPTD